MIVLYLYILNQIGNKKELEAKNIITLAFIFTYVIIFTEIILSSGFELLTSIHLF